MVFKFILFFNKFFFNNIFIAGPFKIIKALLPANAVEILKIVDSKSLKEYIDEDNMLKCWGGKDDYVYSFDLENIAQEPTPALVPSITNKKVNFNDKHNSSDIFHFKIVIIFIIKI